MNESQRDAARDAALELLSTPRSHLRVHLQHAEGAVTVHHKEQTLTGVELDKSGMNAASAIAMALGVNVPDDGESTEVMVSTGLLYRVLSLSDLDYNNPVSFEVASNLVDEAISMQRGRGALSDA